jgi:hypothetical protein
MSIVIRKFERIGFNDVYFLLLINSEYVTFLSIRNGVDTKKRKLLGLIVTVAILFLGTGFGFPVGQLPLLSLGKSLMTTSPGSIPPTFNIEVDTSNDTGQHTSVAFNWWDGHTYVSYYNATNKELRMAYDIGSGGNCGPDDSWLCLTVDSDGDVGQYNSIAVGAGFVNISYHDASNGDLKWAESTDPPLYTFWKIRTIDRGGSTTTAGLFTSINLFDGKYPRISYYSDNSGDVDELRLASYIGSSGGNCGWGDDAGKWNCRTIKTGEGVGQHASMMHDSNWHKYIAYYDATNGGLWMATNKSGSNCGPGGNSWSCFPVSVPSANVGKYSSFYLDSSNQYHIAYYDATNDTLRYAHEVGSGGNCGVLGGAQCDTIDTMQADYHPVGIVAHRLRSLLGLAKLLIPKILGYLPATAITYHLL